MRSYTEEEFHTLPHAIMTSEKEWDPRVFDNLIDPADPNYNAMKKPNHKLLPYDDYDVSGECIGIAQAHQVGDIPSFKMNFWLSEAWCAHNESVARCVHGDLRSNEDTRVKTHGTQAKTYEDAQGSL